MRELRSFQHGRACSPQFCRRPTRRDAASGTERVQVQLTPPVDSVGRRLFRDLHRATVERQAWRWHGRPAALPPELQRDYVADDPARKTDMQEWVAVEFGERPDDSFIESAMLEQRPSSRGTGLPAAFPLRRSSPPEQEPRLPRSKCSRATRSTFSVCGPRLQPLRGLDTDARRSGPRRNREAHSGG